MLILNTTDQEIEILEGQRRYREQMATQYTAGYTDAEEKLNPVISGLNKQVSDLNDLLQKYRDKYGDI